MECFEHTIICWDEDFRKLGKLDKLLLKVGIVDIYKIWTTGMARPSDWKWETRLEYYIRHKKPEVPIEVQLTTKGKLMLVDGYTTYLIYRELTNKRWIKVVVRNGKN